MQVLAFSSPQSPDWRWRIVNYEGEMVEESSRAFSSIAGAVAEGARRLREMGDVPHRAPAPRSITYGRRR